jgi:hypothetical protein
MVRFLDKISGYNLYIQLYLETVLLGHLLLYINLGLELSFAEEQECAHLTKHNVALGF